MNEPTEPAVILTKAIEKAIDNGFMPTSKEYLNWSTFEIVFNHDFARALWGEVLWWTVQPGKSGGKRKELEIPEWKMHLQQMVIADDPIKYLGENT